MSNLKKILALALAFAMAFTMAAGALTYPSGGYLDNDEINADTLDSIVYLANLGLMNGAPASVENAETGAVTQGYKFMPTDTLTRAQFCRVVYSIETGKDNADLYKGAVKTGFTDVPSTEWFAGYVNYAWLMGWVSGKSATKFDPNGELKLSEAATLVLAYLGYDKEDLKKNWPSNALMYGNIKGLFDNGVDASGTVSGPIQRQWASVLITNALNCSFVTKNDAGKYVDVEGGTVKSLKLGKYKEITGTIVANNRFGILGQDKTDNANKFKLFVDADNDGVVDTDEAIVAFSKEFNTIEGKLFTDTDAVSKSINLGDTYLGAKATILYRETAKGNVIMTYVVDSKFKTGAVAQKDIKFKDNKVTLGSLAAEKEYADTALNSLVLIINGKKYLGSELGIGTGANLKTFVEKFPANTTFNFSAYDGKLVSAVITYLTFDKVAAVTVAEYAKQTPNEFGAQVTVIKIGGTEYKRADGKIVNTGSTDQGNVADKAKLIEKDDYALFWVDAVTGNITINEVAKAEAKADYVVDGAAADRIISIAGKAYKKGSIVADGDQNIAVSGTAVNVKFSLVSANGKALFDAASFAGNAGKDFFTYVSGDVIYIVGLKEAVTATSTFFATKDAEVRYLGTVNSTAKYTYVLTGLVDGAAKTYTIENVSVIDSVAAIAADHLYTLTFTDGVVSAASSEYIVTGVVGDAAGQYEYNSTAKTLTAVTGGTVYLLSGAKIYGFKGDDASSDKDFDDDAIFSSKNIVVTAGSVYIVTDIYIEQD